MRQGEHEGRNTRGSSYTFTNNIYLGNNRLEFPCTDDTRLPLQAALNITLLGQIFDFHRTTREREGYFGELSQKIVSLPYGGIAWNDCQNRFKAIVSNTWGESQVTNIPEAFGMATNTIRWVEEHILDDRKYEMRNEGIFSRDPIRLMQILFLTAQDLKNPLTPIETRGKKILIYEILRKFAMAEVAHNILSDASYQESTEAVSNFNYALSEAIWDGGLGVTNPYKIISLHAASDFRCIGYRLLPEDGNVLVRSGDLFYKVHTRGLRTFTDLFGKRHTVIDASRSKREQDILLKLYREGKKTSRFVDDHNGVTMVFESEESMMAFFETLQVKLGIMILPSELKDSLSNRRAFNGSRKGSSNKFEVMKYNFKFQGKDIEFQGFLIPGYFDSRYRNEVSWDELSVRRFCEDDRDGSVRDLLYPDNLYGIDWDKTSKRKISEIRREKQAKASYIPGRGMFLRSMLDKFRSIYATIH